MSWLLEARAVSSGHGSMAVTHDIDIGVGPGEVVALLGPNGAGKSTTLMTLAGELAPMSGDVLWNGVPAKPGLAARARSGVRFVSEERSVFMGMTVSDNLQVGHSSPRLALKIFPELGPLMKRKAGLLSGGEQQMLTVGRALSGQPKVLLVDELSLGLAPLVVVRLLRAIQEAAEGGTAVIVVEQHVREVLAIADRGYVISRGRIAMSGTSAELNERRDLIERSYLGGEQWTAPPAEQRTMVEER